MKKPFSLFLALLATLSAAQTPADRDAARKAAEAERLPSAETLYKQHKWREAEKAFSAYASGHPRPADAAAALLRVADCREKMGDRKGSTLMLDRVARDAESLRREPDACAAAWCRLYRGAVQNSADSASRLRLLSDARSRLPAHSEILSLCEAEADAQLSAGNSSKAQELYGMAGRCLSPSGTNCLAYIHSCATLTAPPLDESDAVSLAALFHDKPSCAKPLSGILSKRRKDGWRALYALARHQAELGDADAALALWDRMLGAGQGQEDILLAAKAEQLLSTGRYSDAKETARRFLDAHAASPQANRVRQILSRAESVLARKEKERSEQEAKRKRQAENPALAELDRAERLLSAGKLAEAERLFRHTAEQEDAILRARASLGLGQVLFAKGSGQDAMKVWQTTWNRRDFAIEEEEKLFLSEVRRSMADLWMEEEGASAKASAAYGEADILHAPVGKWETTPRRTRRIVALAMSGKPGEAAELTRLLARSAPDGSMAALRWQTLAEDIAKGRLSSSSSAPKLRVALSQLSLAETLYAAGDAKGALRVYQRVSAIPEARSLADHADFGAAMSLAALGKEKDAVEALLRIPRKHPQSELRPLAFLNAGTMAANPPLRDGQKARKTLAQLTAAFPKSREAEAGEFIAATIAWKEKKWAEAKKRHMDFLEAHPDSRLVSMIRETRLPAIAAHSTLPPQTAPFRLEHRVVVGPHDSKWRPYHLDFSDACDCILRIFPADGYAIASCDVDVRPFQPERPIPYKWVLMDKSATEYRFEITHAFSSLEYGFFQGKLAGRKQGGGGPGRPEVLPFDVTVPAVDIDWNEAYGWQEELDEDNTVENIPATAIPTERRTFLIREPDDSNRHRIETLQLAWDKPDALQVLRVDTGEEVTSGWTFRREDVAFPLFFQAIPKDGGWGEVTLTLEGWAGRPRPEYDEDISFDKIKGRIVRIDLDVDSDNNGTIDEISPSAEDDSEDDATLPGKALFLNELDTDRDGIPDWADGYDVLLNGSSQKSANASRPFTLLRLEAKAPPVGATIRFECSSLDDTASAFLSGNGIRDDPYTYATAAPIKKIRIWAKNGDHARSKNPFPSGDLILPNREYSVSDLLPSGTRFFYVEAIGGSTAIGDIRISAILSYTDQVRRECSDAVRLTVFHIEAVHPVEGDFSVNDRVVVFWKEGQFNSQITAVSGNLVGLNPLPSTIPKWGGIRLQSDNETYSVDLSLLPKAYGGDADGRDGGAFIEFKTLSTGCDMVPKYTCFPTDNSIRANYAWYWFQHKRQQNVTHLLAASRLYNPFVPGSSFINYPLSVIFCEQATPPFENAETVVHELGHRMGLRPGNGGNFQHIDKDHPGQSDRIVKTHDGLIACVMGYDNPSDGTAEFCIDCILTGSTTGAEDSLRDCVDQ